MKKVQQTSVALLCACGLLASIGCSDEGEGDGQGGSVATGGAGAGAGPTDGGASASGGNGAGGGGGSAPQGCLDAAPYAGLFTILDDDLCLYQVIDGPTLDSSVNQPSWGAHGGPLQVVPGANAVSVVRWTLGAGDVLTDTSTTAATTGIPADAFWGGLAVDVLPSSLTCDEHFAQTAWTGADFLTQGELVTAGPGANASQTVATGVFGLATFGGRLFYTGMSAAGGPTNGELALYFADLDADACDGTLAGAGKLAAGWGLATGPVTVDSDGNVFAVMTDYVAGTQELHGYAADEAQGAGPITGQVGATFDGFGDAFAALAPSGDKPGLLMLQTNDATTFEYLDVVGQEYSSAGGSLTLGLTKDVLHFASPDTNATMFVDDQSRIWVGLPYHQKNAPFQSTKFYVFGRTTN